MATRPRLVQQMAFDEQIIEDAALETALELRWRKKGSLDAVRKVYDDAHEAAQLEIAKLELPEGGGSAGRSLPDHADLRRRAQRDLRDQGQQSRSDRARRRGRIAA